MVNISKEIHVRESAGIVRSGEYIRVAVPFARGELQPNTQLSVTDPAGNTRPYQAKVLKQWPDGTVKWLLIDCAVEVPAGGTACYRITPSTGVSPELATSVRVIQGADIWQVDTGTGQFDIDTRTFRPFATVKRNGVAVLRARESSCLLSVDGKSEVTPSVEEIQLEDSGPLRAILRVAGRFVFPSGEGLRFHARIHFIAGNMAVQVEFTIHNPQAARHPGGLWDLGDSGSFLFKELAFVFPFVGGLVNEVRSSPEIDAIPLVSSGKDRFRIYQESSGGVNWQSPNHRNREGRVPFSRRGYLVEIDGRQTASGVRSSPLVWCGASGEGVAAALPYFWQEFPKAVEAGEEELKIALFPAQFPDLHELQGGEQKTHFFFLDFAARPDSLRWALAPVWAMAAPQEYRASGIFIDLPEKVDLIDRFTSPAELLRKREVVDEYGWRNFGEIYADHEAVYHKAEVPFVSHYNNQYDFIAGAYRKSFATGDIGWRELAAEMARHVRDVDLYHTDLDREEYNHGLFWHTDHYIDAGLSTHRSFSRDHLKTKPSRFCGGGPGPQHCYTTGLMLHYFHTANPAFKEAVIAQARWVLRALDGSQAMLAAIKRGMGYLNLWRASNGSKRLFSRYPLTRGTGNAITACLDAFEVGGDEMFLAKAEELIRGALHPNDDIEARSLLDAEIAWSYTVLLVAVAKFLDKKLELGELDDGFAYARASLLAYAEWMLQHEYPYLEKPEILEYPNETWPAQDIRKSVIFFHASRYAPPDLQEQFKKKGKFFFVYARDELVRHETSGFTRPVVLMLQNGWVGELLATDRPSALSPNFIDCSFSGQKTPYLTLGVVVERICLEMQHAMRETSLQQEVTWLLEKVKYRNV